MQFFTYCSELLMCMGVSVDNDMCTGIINTYSYQSHINHTCIQKGIFHFLSFSIFNVIETWRFKHTHTKIFSDNIHHVCDDNITFQRSSCRFGLQVSLCYFYSLIETWGFKLMTCIAMRDVWYCWKIEQNSVQSCLNNRH